MKWNMQNEFNRLRSTYRVAIEDKKGIFFTSRSLDIVSRNRVSEHTTIQCSGGLRVARKRIVDFLAMCVIEVRASYELADMLLTWR